MNVKAFMSTMCGIVLTGINLINAQTYTISTMAGTGTEGYSGDGGPALTAEFHWPGQLTTDASGNLYITDQDNNAIRKINPAGIITTVISGGSIHSPSGVAIDASGNVYFSEFGNNLIDKIDPDGVLTVIAGNGNVGYSGDGGLATNAEFFGAYGLALDVSGNVYVADNGNNRIRKISTSGIITTVAGNGIAGYSGDGGLATAAQLNGPTGIDIDAAGNIYISDEDNNRIRKINTSGIITTIAGTGTGYDGDGGLATDAQLNSPDEVTVDALGNIYIAEYFNDVIRKINTSGIITTIAGNGTFGYSGDGGLATAAQFSSIHGVAVDATGTIYIADSDNNRIRKLSNVTGVEEFADTNFEISIYPNPTEGIINVEHNFSANANPELSITNVQGQTVISCPVSNQHQRVDVSSLSKGVYFATITSKEGKSKTFKIVRK